MFWIVIGIVVIVLNSISNELLCSSFRSELYKPYIKLNLTLLKVQHFFAWDLKCKCIFTRYAIGKYACGKYAFRKYAFRKYAFGKDAYRKYASRKYVFENTLPEYMLLERTLLENMLRLSI